MSRLRLGPILEERPVKLTVELPGEVARDLARYAELHAAQSGGAALPPEKLVAAMVRQFIAGDREFRKLKAGPALGDGRNSTR